MAGIESVDAEKALLPTLDASSWNFLPVIRGHVQEPQLPQHFLHPPVHHYQPATTIRPTATAQQQVDTRQCAPILFTTNAYNCSDFSTQAAAQALPRLIVMTRLGMMCIALMLIMMELPVNRCHLYATI